MEKTATLNLKAQPLIEVTMPGLTETDRACPGGSQIVAKRPTLPRRATTIHFIPPSLKMSHLTSPTEFKKMPLSPMRRSTVTKTPTFRDLPDIDPSVVHDDIPRSPSLTLSVPSSPLGSPVSSKQVQPAPREHRIPEAEQNQSRESDSFISRHAKAKVRRPPQSRRLDVARIKVEQKRLPRTPPPVTTSGGEKVSAAGWRTNVGSFWEIH